MRRVGTTAYETTHVKKEHEGTAEGVGPTRSSPHSDVLVVFCGPRNHDGRGVSGGRKRMLELYSHMQRSGYATEWVGNWTDLSRARSRAVEGERVCIVFDERYLPLGIRLRMCGFKLVCCPRGNKVRHYEYFYSSIRLWVYKKGLSLLYRFCDLIVYQLDAQRIEFEAMYEVQAPAKVVPNNVNVSWVEQDAPEQCFGNHREVRRIGFLGGDNPRKGFNLLLEGWRRARASGLQADLVVAGPFGLVPVPDEGMEVLGVVYDLRRFYEEVDLVVVPSHYDTFPNVFLEALALCTPVLMTQTPMTREICGENRSLLFEADPVALSRRLLDCQQGRDTLALIVDECRELRYKYLFPWAETMERAILGRR